MIYRKGFKYQLAKQLHLKTNIYPKEYIDTDFVIMHTDGTLVLKKGFAWDGASGPVIDRKTNMIAGAGHDALYRLMRKEKLDYDLWPQADLMFSKWLIEAGAWAVTIKIDMLGLKIANGKAAHPDSKQEVYQV